MSRQPVLHDQAWPWTRANRDGLLLELDRLRLVLHRRVLWLRMQWAEEPLPLQPYRGMVISDAQADRLLAGEDRPAETRFYQDHQEAIELGRRIAEVEHRAAAHWTELAEAGRPGTRANAATCTSR